MLIANIGTASRVNFSDNVHKYFTEVSFSQKMWASIYETPLVCRSTSLERAKKLPSRTDGHGRAVDSFDHRAACANGISSRIIHFGETSGYGN